MNEFKEFFDDFTFSTRIIPSLVTVVPIVLLGLYKSIINEGILNNTMYFFVIIVLISLYGNIARNLGKKKETDMINRLGAWPTTIIMRFNDKRIDKITKVRYYRKLNKIVDDLNLPLSSKEEKALEDSDEVYNSAVNWLRNHANADVKKYSMVYRELKYYNFWRNLYGIKRLGIVVYCLIALREYYFIDNFNIKNVFFKPYPQYVSFIVMIFSIVVLFFMVNKKVVERKAFDYAKALIETCEIL